MNSKTRATLAQMASKLLVSRGPELVGKLAKSGNSGPGGTSKVASVEGDTVTLEDGYSMHWSRVRLVEGQ